MGLTGSFATLVNGNAFGAFAGGAFERVAAPEELAAPESRWSEDASDLMTCWRQKPLRVCSEYADQSPDIQWSNAIVVVVSDHNNRSPLTMWSH